MAKAGKKRGVMYIRVVRKPDVAWCVGLSRCHPEGWSLNDGPHNKGEAMKLAEKYAKQFRPSVVRVYDQNNRLQNHYSIDRAGRETIIRGGDVA